MIDHVPSNRCPSCGGLTLAMILEQPALFIHGGYGATLRTIVRYCGCGWALDSERTEVRP